MIDYIHFPNVVRRVKFSIIRECVSTGVAGAWTWRSSRQRILRPRALFYRTDCTRRSKFLTHALIIAKFCNDQPCLFSNLSICSGDINFEVGRDIFFDPFIQKFLQNSPWVFPNALPSFEVIRINLSWHFSMKIIKRLGFFKDDCLVSLILKPLYLLKSCRIFLGTWKVSQSI